MAGRRQQKIALYLEGHPKNTGVVDEAIVFFKLSSHRKGVKKQFNRKKRVTTATAIPLVRRCLKSSEQVDGRNRKRHKNSACSVNR